VGLNDISELFITAIMSALLADGQAGPNGLFTAQARFSAFTLEDKFTFAEPVSSERSSGTSGSEGDNSAAIHIVGFSVGGCCIVCAVVIVAIVYPRKHLTSVM